MGKGAQYMIRHCKILEIDNDGEPQLAGTFTLSEARVLITASEGSENIMNGIFDTPNWIEGGKRSVTACGDPQKWFDALGYSYSGSRLRAQFQKTRRAPRAASAIQRREAPSPGLQGQGFESDAAAEILKRKGIKPATKPHRKTT
jgi:hypothetical protein